MWLASVLPRRIVRAATVFAFLAAVAVGTPAARAWRAVSAMALRTGYRVRCALANAGPSIRTARSARAPPPASLSSSPDAQLVAHVRALFGDTGFSAFQLTFQRSVLA